MTANRRRIVGHRLGRVVATASQIPASVRSRGRTSGAPGALEQAERKLRSGLGSSSREEHAAADMSNDLGFISAIKRDLHRQVAGDTAETKNKKYVSAFRQLLELRPCVYTAGRLRISSGTLRVRNRPSLSSPEKAPFSTTILPRSMTSDGQAARSRPSHGL
jgi:hypothetical protein